MDMAFHSNFAMADGPAHGESGAESARALRPLGWADLCARLVASHDFRAARATHDAGAERQASFHGSAAQWLGVIRAQAADRPARLVDRAGVASGFGPEHETTVNPTPSVAVSLRSGIGLPDDNGATSLRDGAQD